MESEHRLSKSSITEEELKKYSVPSDDDDDNDVDDDDHSVIADGDIATNIDDNQTSDNNNNNLSEPVIVLKQIRRLSSVDNEPGPSIPPTKPTVTVSDIDMKAKQSNNKYVHLIGIVFVLEVEKIVRA